jgi:hypothetical protein
MLDKTGHLFPFFISELKISDLKMKSELYSINYRPDIKAFYNGGSGVMV